MKGKSKYLSIMLIAVMIIVLLAACSSSNNGGSSSDKGSDSTTETNTKTTEQETGGSGEAALDPYELTMAVPVFGPIPQDLEEVQAEINKITQAEINTTVTILPISIGAWGQQMNLMMSGGEKLDLSFAFGAQYPSQASTGQLVLMDELLVKYGEGITKELGDYIKAASIEGKIYGVPITGPYAQNAAVYMRKDLVEKHNIDISAITSLADMERVYQVIKEKEPGIYPLAAGLTSPLEYIRNYDRLGDGFGVLPGFDNGLKVENYYETQEYADYLNLMRNWYKAGYINKDAATTQSTVQDYMKAGKAFSYVMSSKPLVHSQEEIATGHELVHVDLLPDSYSTTDLALIGLYTIAHHSENPERAMMMLNLMYTNSDLVNLLVYGIEGKHYVKVGETQYDFPEGVDAKTTGYSLHIMVTGNTLLARVHTKDDPNTNNMIRTFNQEAKKSKAFGFAFNPASVKNEVTALQNVTTQYRKILETGSIDPTDKLNDFNAKLKAAGIDKVIAEKQKQLDAWAAAQ